MMWKENTAQKEKTEKKINKGEEEEKESGESS